MIKHYKYDIESDLLCKIDAFVSDVTPQSVFHKSTCFKLYAKTKFIEPIYIVSYSKGEINGVILVALMQSYPLGRFGKRLLVNQLPVVKPDTPEVFKNLITYLKEQFGKKAFFVEIRNVIGESPFDNEFRSCGYSAHKRVNLVIDFNSHNTFDTLSDSKKRQINKAFDEGVSLGEFTNISEVHDFYAILKKLYVSKVKKPLPHISFFETAFCLSKTNSELQLSAVRFNGKVIGGILTAGVSGYVVYEWYVGGMHADYKLQYPSVMATWGGIINAQAMGAKRFDFFGGGVPGKSYGVREFKARFGSSEVSVCRWQWSAYAFVFKWVKLFLKHKNVN